MKWRIIMDINLIIKINKEKAECLNVQDFMKQMMGALTMYSVYYNDDNDTIINITIHDPIQLSTIADFLSKQ